MQEQVQECVATMQSEVEGALSEKIAEAMVEGKMNADDLEKLAMVDSKISRLESKLESRLQNFEETQIVEDMMDYRTKFRSKAKANCKPNLEFPVEPRRENVF